MNIKYYFLHFVIVSQSDILNVKMFQMLKIKEHHSTAHMLQFVSWSSKDNFLNKVQR